MPEVESASGAQQGGAPGAGPAQSEQLHTEQQAGAFSLTAPGYRLSWDAARPYLRLEDAHGRLYATLFLCPSLHTTGGLDRTARLEEPQLERAGGGVRIVFELRGGLWRRKRLVLTCDARGLDLSAEVEGEGDLTDVLLLGGYYSGQPRWGSGFFESGAGFDTVFNPEPWRREQRSTPASQSTTLDVMGVSLPGKAHWFFTPAPLLLAFHRSGPKPDVMVGADGGGTPQTVLEGGQQAQPFSWLAASVVAPIGELNFSALHYDAHESGFSLRLAYEGQTRVSGRFATPSLRLEFAPDPYAAIARNAELHAARGLISAPRRDLPQWWSSPIKCGWGAQCHLANTRGGRAPDHSTQANYDGFLAALEGHGLRPGIVVLDDKWSLSYGMSEVDPAKWPDLKGWIKRVQARGQRVLLWWKAWDPEGLPPEACVTDELGQIITADPTSPAYRRILTQSVRRMLLDYGADGFKVDFSARTPSGPGLRRHGSAWGVALLHELLKVLYDASKACKPDALIMTHTPHPAFGDVTDMIRLNDVNGDADVNAQMLHRGRVARAALPQHLIDTDNWPMPSRAAWREYVRLQPSLGIPSLYFATHIDGDGLALDPEDAELIRQSWLAWDEQRARSPHVAPPHAD